MKKIEYTLPILGFAEVPLYGEAEEIYQFLEDHDQIARLNNLNQLGIISNVIQTAHHPKFEYTFLLLYLIEKIKDLKGLYPLNRDVVRDITGTELLKIWALLLPIGHMPGTFPVEKAILRYLFENSAARDNFINVIKPEPVKEYANQMIFSQNIYSFYHVLSLVKISRYCHNKNQVSFRKKAIELLSMYCQQDKKECINSLKELFSKLRRFSYIMLDGYYTGTRNIFNIEDLNKISNVIPNVYFENMVNSLDSYLINQIYKNKKCTIAEVILYQGIYEELNKHRDPMALVTNYMYTKHNADVYDIYNDYKKMWKIEPANFDDFLIIETNRTNIFRQEDEIRNILSRFIAKKERMRRILFDVDRPPGLSKSSITIYVRNDFKFKRVGLVPGIVREALAESFRNESVKYNPLFRLPQFKDYPEFHLLLKKQINERNFKNILGGSVKSSV